MQHVFLQGVLLQQHEVMVRRDNSQHTVIFRADPRFYRPVTAVHVPDGGAGWAFIVTAVAMIGLAAAKRYSEKISLKRLLAR